MDVRVSGSRVRMSARFPTLRAMGIKLLDRDVRLDICPDVRGISCLKSFSLSCLTWTGVHASCRLAVLRAHNAATPPVVKKFTHSCLVLQSEGSVARGPENGKVPNVIRRGCQKNKIKAGEFTLNHLPSSPCRKRG